VSFDLQTLYGLLPAVYRLRDAERGEPLKALLSVIAEQVAVLEEDVRRLYDDQFIETCAGWAIPYIGDAVGYRALHGEIASVKHPRAEVADTIALRRHKGTAAMLEVLSREVTGWDARVVEFFELLATTQYMNHLRPHVRRPDLRRMEPLEYLGSAFESIPHCADVRRIATAGGRFNIPNIGILLWRLGAKSLTRSPAFAVDAQRFLFSPLGNSAPLFTLPQRLGAIDEFTRRVGRLNVPDPLRIRIADAHLADYYGEGRSFVVYVGGLPLALADVCICDLGDLLDANGQPTGDWAHVPPPPGKVAAIDPVVGRIAFAAPAEEVDVTFHAGFSDDLGGGEYDRQRDVGRWFDPKETEVTFQFGVTQDPTVIINAPDPTVLGDTLQDAIDAWNAFVAATPSGFGVICLMDSRVYSEDIAVQVPAGFTLAIVAADWPVDAGSGQRELGVFGAADCWPTLTGDVDIAGTAPIDSDNPGTLILDGLRFAGTVSVADGHLGRLALSHCTVVPWTDVGLDRRPLPTSAARLVNEDGQCRLEAYRCILGALRSPAEARAELANCILDATRDSFVAFAAPDGVEAGAVLSLVNCTVVGKVRTRMMELASGCLFVAGLAVPDPGWTSPVRSERRQHGCVRFSRIPEGSRLPRRYRCQPDLALQARAKELGLDTVEDLTADERERIVLRLAPLFESLTYGDPAYAQLSRRDPVEIREGGEGGVEMGAFHDLFHAHREQNLRRRLDEYLRFGLQAGVFYET
jgi:hypothetical protein